MGRQGRQGAHKHEAGGVFRRFAIPQAAVAVAVNEDDVAIIEQPERFAVLYGTGGDDLIAYRCRNFCLPKPNDMSTLQR